MRPGWRKARGQLPNFASRPACAKASDMMCRAAMVPRSPDRHALSVSRGPVGRARRDRIRSGTACHEWPAMVAGVLWSPVTINTPPSSSLGRSRSSASIAATLPSKSPSSPRESVAL